MHKSFLSFFIISRLFYCKLKKKETKGVHAHENNKTNCGYCYCSKVKRLYARVSNKTGHILFYKKTSRGEVGKSIYGENNSFEMSLRYLRFHCIVCNNSIGCAK